MACPVDVDNVFGPIVRGCTYLDFTLLFEQTILSMIPSTLLLCIAPSRTALLWKKPIKTLKQRGFLLKLAVLLSLAAVQLASLVRWSELPHTRTNASISATFLNLISILALIALSYAEHTRSIRPSALIDIYLVVSLVLDVPQARTLWIRSFPKSVAALFVSGIALKAAALLIESRNKRGALTAPYNTYPPEALSGFISRSLQWWINPLFVRGFRSVLSIDSLFPPDARVLSEKLQTRFLHCWSRSNEKRGGHPLRRALAAQLMYDTSKAFVARLCLTGFTFCQPLLINRVVATLSSKSDQSGSNKLLIAAAALIYIGLAVSNSVYKTQMNRIMTMIRGILVSTTFKHTIQCHDSSSRDKAPLTLMTTDVQRITMNLSKTFDGIAGAPVDIAIAVFLLSREIGWTCVLPIIISLAATIWAVRNSGSGAPRQRAWAMATQERVTFTAEVLGIPKAMKMLGLTDLFNGMIQDYRVREVERCKSMLRFGTLRSVVGTIPAITAPCITLTVFVLAKNHGVLNSEQAFTALSIIALLTTPVESLVQAIPQLGSATACLDRIEEFLLKPSAPSASVGQSPILLTSEEGIEMSRIPSEDHQRVSETASRSILAEMNDASFGYKANEPAVIRHITATIIERSLTVIYGPVGSGKTTFIRALFGDARLCEGSVQCHSGAVSYCAQEPWLPNVRIRDAIVMKKTYSEEWYNTVLRACCLLPDLDSLPQGDQTKIGTKGVSLSGGQRQRLALARALYARNQLLLADDVLSGLDVATASRVFDRVFGRAGICKQYHLTAVFVTQNVKYAPGADQIIVFGQNGNIRGIGPFESVREFLDGETSVAGSDCEESEQPKSLHVLKVVGDTRQKEEEDKFRKTGDFSIFKYYVNSAGLIVSCAALALCSGAIFFLLFPQVWLKWWAESDNRNNTTYVAVYFSLAVAANVLGGCAMLFFTTVFIPLTSRSLHHYLLDAVLDAPYSYFTSTDSGVTLNRFSQDMAMIDANLAGNAYMTLTSVLQGVMEAGLIIAGSVYLTAAIPAVLAAIFAVQKVYLRTSRQLRYLDLETQAPLQTHFLESIEGLSTIRAFGWQEDTQNASWRLLDLSQRPYYLLRCIQVWLGLVLDLISAGLAILVVSIAVSLESKTNAGSIGVSLISILGFNTTLTNIVNSWTGMETSLGAVARVKNFVSSTELENSLVEEALPPAQEWPLGQIDFNSLAASYKVTSEPTLNGLDLHIRPGEKIGICGRTGSGKSSVISALFRMVQTTSGSLEIDGIDVRKVSTQTLASNIAAISQEPLLLPGSLRFNVDPYGHAQDEEIILALTKVGLWETLHEREITLDGPLTQNSLSIGQQQLLGVARAILRKTKILVLDEVTSSLDTQAENTVMDLIKNEFVGSTVIAVAHRVKTLLDFDRIVVLEGGRIAEIGTPAELLRGQTLFKKMVEGS